MEHSWQHTEHTKKRYNATSVVYNIMEWPVEQLWYKTWRKKLWKKSRDRKSTRQTIAHIANTDIFEGVNRLK